MDNRIEQALEVIAAYGGDDGGHHKQWTLDQVVRVLTGGAAKYERVTFVDDNGKPHYLGMQLQITTDSEQYENWVNEYNNGEDGPNTYEWETGIAP